MPKNTALERKKTRNVRILCMTALHNENYVVKEKSLL
jgi:hypothetical protein